MNDLASGGGLRFCRVARRFTTISSALFALSFGPGCTGPEEELEQAGEVEQRFWVVADGHEQLTRDGLPFLKTGFLGFGGVLEDIADANEDTDGGDTQALSVYHFDNCQFAAATTTLNQRLDAAVAALGKTPPDFATAVAAFGNVLHTTQDFYAHSNWVESSETGLFDKGYGPFAIRTPWTRIGDNMLVLGSSGRPANFTLVPIANSRLVDVQAPTRTFAGLISGEHQDNWHADGTDASLCPTEKIIPHGPRVTAPGPFANEWEFLAKDTPFSPYRGQAEELARKQTQHEFCRLVNLLETRHGRDAKERLYDEWVDDVDAANAACPAGNVDVALVLDSSGSMTTNDPLNKRLAAARAYVLASIAGDHVGVVDFDSTARTLVGLTSVPDGISTLNAAIDRVDSSGGTNIGAGVAQACSVLNATQEGNKGAAILLTDGQGSYSGQAQCFIDKSWRLYTFAFGDANDSLLTQIATSTGGEHLRLPTSNLVCEFQRVRAKIAGIEPAPCTTTTVGPNQTVALSVDVPVNQEQATFSSSWPGSDVVMTLISPSGRVITRGTQADDIERNLGPTHEIVTVRNPEAGTWRVELYGLDVAPPGEEVVFGLVTIPKAAPPATPPVANAGLAQELECSSHTGTPGTLDGTGSTTDAPPLTFAWQAANVSFDDPANATPSATFPLGTTEVNLVVVAANGLSGSASTAVTVVDTTAPSLTVAASPLSLWPPNHKYIAIEVLPTVTDSCDPAVSVTATVSSNEPDNSNGDGNTTGDIRVTGATVRASSSSRPALEFDPLHESLELRSERSGGGVRVYTIDVTAEDASGNQTKRQIEVRVDK